MNLKTKLGILRILSLLEGISIILLFGVTMPLSKIYKIEEPNFYMGLSHGLLFISYSIFVILVSHDKKWSFKTTFLAGIASLLPFGTFVADSKIFKKY
jgi:integral membrane protein